MPVSRGSQLPRIHSVPPYASSTGPEAIELAHLAGLELDEWQQWALIQMLGERADFQWASFGVGICVPRQNGKGGLLEARELAGLFLLNERLIIHSAHQADTSDEAFERLVGLIENTPTLNRRIARNGIRRANGQQGIRTKTGSRIRFRTRTKGGGRGFSSDCLILDECMILPDAFMNAVLPTLSARPNPQLIYTGSAVDQTIHEHGLVFARVRERGIEGTDPSLFYAEWSATDSLDDVTLAMASDPDAWAVANPAFGIRISPEYIAAERREFASNLRGFAVERLGVGDWPNTAPGGQKIVDPDDWTACEDQESQIVGPVSFAFDVTPDRTWACVSVAGNRADGLPQIEVVAHRRGTRWVPEWLAGRIKKHRTGAVFCADPRLAGRIIAELEDHKIEVVSLSAGDMAQACGVFYDAVSDGRQLRHLGQPELDGAVSGARTRTLGDAYAWDRKSSEGDISPLISSTAALWGLKFGPKPRSRVIHLSDFAAEEG